MADQPRPTASTNPPPRPIPCAVAGPGPISPSIAGMQCNNGLTKECSLFSDTYFQGERFVISALAIQGWVFYLNAGRAKSGAILIRCRGADTNTCDTYSVMSEVRCEQQTGARDQSKCVRCRGLHNAATRLSMG